jgi:hypothetical protein
MGDPGTFQDYLARNLSDAYRLAVLTTDDPVLAGSLVRAAVVSVWRDSVAATGAELDQELRLRLEDDIEARLASGETEAAAGADGAEGADADPLAEAVRVLSPRRRIELAHAFGPGGPGFGIEGASPAAAGLGVPLRALFESRDPGDPPPLQLRLQLDEDRRLVEAVRPVRTGPRRRSGWGFAFNAGLTLIVLTLVVALVSIVGVRSSAVAGGDPVGDPSSPLTISRVTLLQGGIDGGAAHVAGTQRSLVAAFPPSPLWQTDPRSCSADVFGAVDWLGQPTWVGARAGHADSVVGDPASASVYTLGLGNYCQPAAFTSSDGGLSWLNATLPTSTPANPSWLAFDPAHVHTLMAYGAGVLYMSPDAGLTWASRESRVTPLAFDSTGRLVGWTAGHLLQSADDGASWQETGAGPPLMPTVAGATSGGALLGEKDGLWWYPLDSGPSLLKPGLVLAISAMGDGAVAVGADSDGLPWLGTVNDSQPGIALADLPPEAKSLTITDAEVALNDSGALIAFSGRSSLIAQAAFVH